MGIDTTITSRLCQPPWAAGWRADWMKPHCIMSHGTLVWIPVLSPHTPRLMWQLKGGSNSPETRKSTRRRPCVGVGGQVGGEFCLGEQPLLPSQHQWGTCQAHTREEAPKWQMKQALVFPFYPKAPSGVPNRITNPTTLFCKWENSFPFIPLPGKST